MFSRRAALGLVATALLPRAAFAQRLDRTARLVVGFAPGGAADVVARLVAERLRGTYASQMVVENRPGAAARLAVEAVRSSPLDGTTMLFTPESILTLYPHIYPRTLRYDGLRDFIPVGTTSSFSFAFVVSAGHPARDLRGFTDWARAQGNAISYASPAAGSVPHFVAEQMARKLDVRLLHVAYRGTVAALPDLVTDRISGVIGVLGDMAERHLAGEVRVLATTGRQRSVRLPDVPTFAEQGLPDLTIEERYAILLPSGTPAPLVAELDNALRAALENSELRAALARMEQVPVYTSPQDLAVQLAAERVRWGPIVRETGYTTGE